MLRREDILKDHAYFRSRARGCLIGLAVGDALGDIGRDQEHRARYGIITDFSPEARSTDDTEFGFLTARTIIDNGGNIDEDSVLRSWKRYILEQGGLGQRAGRPLYGAVENLKRGLGPPLSGTDNVFNNDDGAAMRMAPVGIFCAGDPDRAAGMAAVEASISHYGDGIAAACATAAAMSAAMAGADMDEIVGLARKQIKSDSWLGRSMDLALEICSRKGCIEDAYEELHTRLWTPIHSVSAEALPQAFSVLLLTRGVLRESVIWSANFGRDADTIAAIVLSCVGARSGIEVFPDRWIEQARKPNGTCLAFTKEEDAISLADALVETACAR